MKMYKKPDENLVCKCAITSCFFFFFFITICIKGRRRLPKKRRRKKERKVLALITGVTQEYQGTSKKGNPWCAHYLQMVWEDATKRGFAAESVFFDSLLYKRYLSKFVDADGLFPCLANIQYDPSGHIMSLEMLDTQRDDIATYFYGAA